MQNVNNPVKCQEIATIGFTSVAPGPYISIHLIRKQLANMLHLKTIFFQILHDLYVLRAISTHLKSLRGQ